MTSRTTLRQPPDIYEIRSRYTTPDNACKATQIQELAPIAIAYDIATLVAEVEDLRNEIGRLKGELRAMRPESTSTAQGPDDA
jgi:hypothetical protein